MQCAHTNTHTNTYETSYISENMYQEATFKNLGYVSILYRGISLFVVRTPI